MALSAGLGGMVLARWMVENASLVQNFQSAVERLKYCAGLQAHRMSPEAPLKDEPIQFRFYLHQEKARPPYQPAPGQGGRESGCGSSRSNQPGGASALHRLSGGLLFIAETMQIHPDKVRAYLATDYRFGHTEQDIILNIVVRSLPLSALFTSSGVACGAFLTAYNPRGSIQSDEANDRGHAELAAMLRYQALRSIEGSGS